MKKIYAIFILFFVLCACATGQKKNEIVVCGDDKVWIVNVEYLLLVDYQYYTL